MSTTALIHDKNAGVSLNKDCNDSEGDDFSFYEKTLTTERDDDYMRMEETGGDLVSFDTHVSTVASNVVVTVALKTWDVFGYVIGMLVRI